MSKDTGEGQQLMVMEGGNEYVWLATWQGKIYEKAQSSSFWLRSLLGLGLL